MEIEISLLDSTTIYKEITTRSLEEISTSSQGITIKSMESAISCLD